MRIPNWKNWPHRAISMPASAVISATAALLAMPHLLALPPLSRVASTSALMLGCFGVGFAANRLLAWLQERARRGKPGHGWMAHRLPDGTQKVSEIYMLPPRYASYDLADPEQAARLAQVLERRKTARSSLEMEEMWRQMAERKQRFIAELREAGRAEMDEELPTLSYADIKRLAGQVPPPRPGKYLHVKDLRKVLGAPYRRFSRRQGRALTVSAFAFCLALAAGLGELTRLVLHEALGAPMWVLALALILDGVLLVWLFMLARRQIRDHTRS